MNISLFRLFLSAVFITTVSSTEICPSGFAPFVRDHGYALVGHVIATLPLFLPDCMTACEETLICFSINVYKDQHGGNVCELNKSNKRQKPESFVRKDGYQYAEAEVKRFCVQKDCPEKEALPDDWFFFNSSYFKHFEDKKPWHDARQYCQALGGDLVSIGSATEEEFIYTLMVQPKRHYLIKRLITDMDLPPSLFNGAKMVEEDGYPSLHLDGVDDYSTAKRFSIHKTSFTIGVWIKTPNPERTMSIISDYTNALNAAFRLYIQGNKIVCKLYTSANNMLRYVSGSSVPANSWLHIAFTWNRFSRWGNFFFNGTFESRSQQVAPDTSRVLYQTGNPKYFIGQDSTGHNHFTGWMRYLIVLSFILPQDKVEVIQDGVFLDGAWIGANDLTQEKTLQWIDGTPLTHRNPTVKLNLNERDCAVMVKFSNIYSLWRMEDCSGQAFFICEKK